MPSVAAEQTYNVRTLGAKGDGVTLDTATIQKALDACKESGGTVIFPPGTYLSQPLTIRASHLTCVYANNSAGDAVQPAPQATEAAKDEGKIPTYRNIRITNVTATCPKAAGVIVGLPESCISDTVLKNVTISAAKGFEICNARNIQLDHVSVTVKAGSPYRLKNAEVKGLK